jgi:hypothetical protein
VLEPHLQSILLLLFWRWGLINYLPRLVSNCYPPTVSQVARITGVSHQHLAYVLIFSNILLSQKHLYFLTRYLDGMA